MEIQNLSVTRLEYNKGQVEGLPKNPRFVRDTKFELTKRSIQEAPEMLNLRELIVYPFGEKYVVICGNLRLRACRELGYDTVPCKILSEDTPAAKLREYAAKDNVSYGENDNDILMNEWNNGELVSWGILEPETKKDTFKERFVKITDEDAVYPLIPKYDEHHQMFIILVESDVDANWLREQLNMQKMKSYKSGKISKSNVISFKDFRDAITKDSNPKP